MGNVLKFYTKYDRPVYKGFSSDEKSRTIQSCKNECDINNILKKYRTTGVLPDLIKQNPQYGDFSTVSDYQSSLNVVLMAQAQFESLSAELREKFSNSPDRFLSFCEDPKNLGEMVKMGLAVAKKPVSVENNPIPQKVEDTSKGASNA